MTASPRWFEFRPNVPTTTGSRRRWVRLVSIVSVECSDGFVLRCAEVVLSAVATVWTLATDNAQFPNSKVYIASISGG